MAGKKVDNKLIENDTKYVSLQGRRSRSALGGVQKRRRRKFSGGSGGPPPENFENLECIRRVFQAFRHLIFVGKSLDFGRSFGSFF